jgi:RNA polymerase sigma-70 factor (ECF subfamily)
LGALEASISVVGRRATTFEAFYDANYGSVCRGLTLALQDPQLAEEATQEAFTRAYVYWRRVARMDRPAGWVYVVAARVAFRRRSRSSVGEIAEAPQGSLADTVVAREMLRAAIEGLPERQRTAIVLRYFADLPLADVAAAMGCALGTVKSTLHAALARLQVELDDFDDLAEVQPDAHR